jgi:hypothetical protein
MPSSRCGTIIFARASQDSFPWNEPKAAEFVCLLYLFSILVANAAEAHLGDLHTYTWKSLFRNLMSCLALQCASRTLPHIFSSVTKRPDNGMASSHSSTDLPNKFAILYRSSPLAFIQMLLIVHSNSSVTRSDTLYKLDSWFRSFHNLLSVNKACNTRKRHNGHD